MRRLLLLLLLGCCSLVLHSAEADGNVGCLFSDTLCTDKIEWCYDDWAFGKCLQKYGNVEEEDLERHELTTDELRAFERELQRLLLLGYRWSHAYTQCILQAMLYATKNRLHYDQKVCDNLIDQDLTAALGAFEIGEQVDPESVAIVRFTPSSELPNSNFADEIYYPPGGGGGGGVGGVGVGDIESYFANNFPQPMPENELESANYETEYETAWPQHVKKSYADRLNRRSLPQAVFSRIYNTPGHFRDGYETRDTVAEQRQQQQQLERRLQDDGDDEEATPVARLLEMRYGNNNNRDPMNAWLESQDIDQLRAALADELLDSRRNNLQQGGFEGAAASLGPDTFSAHYNTPDTFRQGYESRDGVLGVAAQPKQHPKPSSEDIPEPRIYMDEDEDERDAGYNREESGSGENEDARLEALRELKYLSDSNDMEYPPYEQISRNGGISLDDDDDDNGEPEKSAAIARLLNRWKDDFAKDQDGEGAQHQTNNGAAYTEGGLVYADDSNGKSNGRQLLTPELGALLADYEWGFKRRERLDVKKPGPPFDVNNRNFRRDSEQNQTHNSVVSPLVKKEMHQENGATNVNKAHDNYGVDTSYVYVFFKDRIRQWKEGERVVRTISDLLNLEPDAFSSTRVDRNEVTFRVEQNSKNYNASEVAKRMDDIKDDLRRRLGVEVTAAGVGDKAKLPAVLRASSRGADDPSSQTASSMWSSSMWSNRDALHLIMALSALMALMCSAGVLLIAYTVFRRRRKLADLNDPDGADASHDYEDLFRDRKAGSKAHADKKERADGKEKHGAAAAATAEQQRIASLSRESDNQSPSTRSSTSSWSEEPALTNMDISTGHMVLTYMEDHLKNKDRLEQEWQALCAYEAEPNSTAAAEKPENVNKNRKPGVLPYDHSRLVLNDVTNMNSSDYINASTITDHDPRNPAYIAAQGPLPHTAPDFWQMVWEQGSVVMVMLTRLTENGTAMCHRYWPDEGSDLYHIYEVHLVSEHIWCDDYLVRSFYLKNLKTGETRTVTQFHFLSWPDRGIPSSTKALLEFRRKVNKSYRGRSCPIVVHCSDGASRTGTYCLIDMVLNRMAKGAKEIDIAATLEHIRDQRPQMVTTKQQFEFVLMAVAEEVHAILKALPAQLQQQHEKREKELAEKEKQEKEKQEK